MVVGWTLEEERGAVEGCLAAAWGTLFWVASLTRFLASSAAGKLEGRRSRYCWATWSCPWPARISAYSVYLS